MLDPNTTPILDAAKDVAKEEKVKVAQLKKKHDKDTFACLCYILNTSSNRLYDLYMLIQLLLEI